SLSKDARLRRTHFRAGRLEPFCLARRAHVALLDSGRPHFVPLVTWHSEGASHHAVPATHTAVLGVNNRPRRSLPEGAHRTNRNTGRILAVHAEPPDIHAAVSLDHVERAGGELFVARFVHREVSVR